MSDTPRTDALRPKMAQLGWPSDGEPVAMLIASHDKLERELAETAKDYRCLAELLDGHDATECRANLVKLKQDLEQQRKDRKQADLDTIRALGERNDARKELQQLKEKQQ